MYQSGTAPAVIAPGRYGPSSQIGFTWASAPRTARTPQVAKNSATEMAAEGSWNTQRRPELAGPGRLACPCRLARRRPKASRAAMATGTSSTCTQADPRNDLVEGTHVLYMHRSPSIVEPRHY